MIHNFSFSKSMNKYFLFSDRDIECDRCKEVIFHDCVLVESYNKKNSFYKIYCEKCLYEIKKIRGNIVQVGSFTICLKEELPFDCEPHWLSPPNLANSSSCTVFNIDRISKEHPEKHVTVDNTKFSGRESFEGAKIGKDVFKELQEKDKEVTEEDFKKLIDYND